MKYVAIDCGKYKTKACAFDSETGSYRRTTFRTRMSEGSFEDDMLEKGTIVVRVDGGDVYKVGPGAKNEAELETSKKSEIHRICTMSAIAMMVEENTKNVKAVIGIPYQLAQDPEKRLEYKDFIIPDKEHTVEIKTSSDGPVRKVTFSFSKRLVYPESIGVLYEYPIELGDITGIIDIGNLNTNCTYCMNYQPQQESSFTDEMGGKILISGLAQQLSSELGARVDDNLVASTLLKDESKRFLMSKNNDKTVEERSRAVINEYLMEHTLNIKRKLDAKHWPTSFMNICMIGGTTKILKPEIRNVFGDVFIPEEPEFVNVAGFLRKMCADDNIDVKKETVEKADKKQKVS